MYRSPVRLGVSDIVIYWSQSMLSREFTPVRKFPCISLPSQWMVLYYCYAARKTLREIRTEIDKRYRTRARNS